MPVARLQRQASIAAAAQRVRSRIALAAARVGRDPAEVGLIAVSKGFSAAEIGLAASAGLHDFGENRVQEALPKIAALTDVRWHMVGQLQRNKCPAVAGRFSLVHGVDRPDLAESLHRAALRAGLVQDVLLQVGLSGRPAQGGAAPAQVAELLTRVAGLGHLRVRGLMVIAPPAADPEEARACFATLRALRDRLQTVCGIALPELSMGMSGDFEVAVEEGATLVRVGRAIFGERVSPAAASGLEGTGANGSN